VRGISKVALIGHREDFRENRPRRYPRGGEGSGGGVSDLTKTEEYFRNGAAFRLIVDTVDRKILMPPKARP